MKSKKFMLKILTLGVTSILLGGAVLTASAASSIKPLKLSRDEAVATAINNSNDIKRVDTGIDTLERKFKKYKKLSDEVRDLKDNFEKYKDAYAKINSKEFKEAYGTVRKVVEGYNAADKTIKDLNDKLKVIPNTPQNQPAIAEINAGIKKAETIKKGILAQLQAKGTSIDDMKKKYLEIQAKISAFESAKVQFIKGGLAEKTTGAPKKLTSEEEYKIFIMPRDVPWYSVQCLLEKALKQKDLAKKIAGVKVNEAYTKILYGEDGYALKSKLYERMTKGYNDLLKSYEVGQSSKIQKDLTKIALNSTKLDIDSLSRTIDNGKTQFKTALGVDITKEIELKDKIDKTIKEPEAFEYYLKKAFENRYEIFTANVDMREADRNFETIREYFQNDDYQWMNVEHELDEAKIALSEAKRKVKKDIENRYLDVKQKRRQINMNVKNLEKAKIQLNAATKSYEIGVKPISLVWDAELGLSKEQMDYDSSIRDYNIALYELRVSSEIGLDMECVEEFKKEIVSKASQMKGDSEF